MFQNSPAQTLNILGNDVFAGDGPGSLPITITAAASHGSASVNTNGTPN